MAPDSIRRVFNEIARGNLSYTSFPADVYIMVDQDCDYYYVIQYERDGKTYTELMESKECYISWKNTYEERELRSQEGTVSKVSK